MANGTVIQNGTLLTTNPPPVIANTKWWPIAVVLVRNGVGILAVIGLVPAVGSDNLANYVLGAIIAVGVIVSEGIGLYAYARGDAEVKAEQIIADKDKSRQENDLAISNNAVKLESLRMENLKLENMRLNLMSDPSETAGPKFANLNLSNSGPTTG